MFRDNGAIASDKPERSVGLREAAVRACVKRVARVDHFCQLSRSLIALVDVVHYLPDMW